MHNTFVRTPRIRQLNQRQMEFVLSRNHVARVAFLKDERIEVQPIHYVFADAIYGRTSFGTKYLAWLDAPEIVFEVDESEGLYDWRSVIVRGTVSLLSSAGSAGASARYGLAIAALRALDDRALTDDDPTNQRTAVFRIDAVEMSGRESVAL
jgi:nitroimidazol reductase NimA-like FMN-containing flavoprotein (pyridoxamine 5'-phosphate oxidase superfamily)